jgi:hypothetical protein
MEFGLSVLSPPTGLPQPSPPTLGDGSTDCGNPIDQTGLETELLTESLPNVIYIRITRHSDHFSKKRPLVLSLSGIEKVVIQRKFSRLESKGLSHSYVIRRHFIAQTGISKAYNENMIEWAWPQSASKKSDDGEGAFTEQPVSCSITYHWFRVRHPRRRLRRTRPMDGKFPRTSPVALSK